MLQNVWLARHGNRHDFVYPEWFLTALRRYDPFLSEDGIVQAKQLAQRLKSETITHIFSSPFLRSIQTANEIATTLNLSIKIEPGLSEWLNPNWMSETPELHPLEELSVTYPCIDQSYQSLIQPQYPESETAVLNRVAETMSTILEQYSGHLLLVGHSITVAGITQSLLQKRIEMKPSLCSLTQLTKMNYQWHLELNCDVSHLSCYEISNGE